MTLLTQEIIRFEPKLGSKKCVTKMMSHFRQILADKIGNTAERVLIVDIFFGEILVDKIGNTSAHLQL